MARVLKRYVGWGLPSLATLAAGYTVLRSIGPLSRLSTVHPHWADLLWVVVLYPLFAAGRGIRFRLLIPARQSWLEAIGVGWMYSAACSLFPGGLGEVSLPMLYRGSRDGGATATAALLVSRVQDLLSWLPLLAAVSFTPVALTPAARLLLIFSVLATGAATAFVFVPRVRRVLLGVVDRLPVPRLRGFLAAFEAQIGGMVAAAGPWLVTLALRALSVATYVFTLRAFGARGSIAEAAVGGGLVALLLVIPIQGVAGLGTAEVWWITALRLFGEPWPVAAVAAIGVHLTLLLLSVILGGVSLPAVRRLLAAGAVRPATPVMVPACPEAGGADAAGADPRSV